MLNTDKELQDAIETLYGLIHKTYVTDLPDPDNYSMLGLRPEVSVDFFRDDATSVNISFLLIPKKSDLLTHGEAND